MGGFLLGIGEINFGMSLLILLMLVLLRLIGGKFTAKCRYILWTLVILRLAVPFSPGIPALIEVPIETEAQPAAAETMSAPVQYPTDYTPVTPAQTGEPIWMQEPAKIPDAPTEIPAPDEHQAVTWERAEKYIPYIYLAGAAAFLLWNFSSYLLYTAKIQRSAREADSGTRAIYEAVCRKNGLRNMPRLLISPDVNSPIAFGLVRRKIVLPDIPLSESGLAGALSHEAMHCKRGDLWVKAAALLARALHWFNPLVHWAAVRCECEMELSCDEAVLAGCGDEVREAYGGVMLDIIRRCRRVGGAMTTHFNPKKSAVKARFANIMYGSGKRRGLWLIGVCVVLCVISGAVVACGMEKGDDTVLDGDEGAGTETGDDSAADMVDETGEGTVTYMYEGLSIITGKETVAKPPEMTNKMLSDLLMSLVTKIMEAVDSPVLDCFVHGDTAIMVDYGNTRYTREGECCWKIKDSFFTEAGINTTEAVRDYLCTYFTAEYVDGLLGQHENLFLELDGDLCIADDSADDSAKAGAIYASEICRLGFISDDRIKAKWDVKRGLPESEAEPETFEFVFVETDGEWLIESAPPLYDFVSMRFVGQIEPDLEKMYESFLKTEFAPYSTLITLKGYLDLDDNGIHELILRDSAYGACEIYTIENGEVRGFYKSDSIFTHYSDERKPLALPSENAQDAMFYGETTTMGKNVQPTFFSAEEKSTGRRGHILCSVWGNEVNRNWIYYFFTQSENGTLTVEKLAQYRAEAVKSNTANGWYFYSGTKMFSGRQFIGEIEALWQKMEEEYGVSFTEENTMCDLTRLTEVTPPDTPPA